MFPLLGNWLKVYILLTVSVSLFLFTRNVNIITCWSSREISPSLFRIKWNWLKRKTNKQKNTESNVALISSSKMGQVWVTQPQGCCWLDSEGWIGTDMSLSEEFWENVLEVCTFISRVGLERNNGSAVQSFALQPLRDWSSFVLCPWCFTWIQDLGILFLNLLHCSAGSV